MFLKPSDGDLVLGPNSSRFKARRSICRGSEVLSFVQLNFITAMATAGNIDSDVMNNTMYVYSGKRYICSFVYLLLSSETMTMINSVH